MTTPGFEQIVPMVAVEHLFQILFRMPSFTRIGLSLLLLLSMVACVAPEQIANLSLAPTPPMGWNSWDAYGLTIDEADFKANALVLAGIKQYGWQYAVIDEGWYMEDPFGGTPEKEKFHLDANGRLNPALNRFPDAVDGAGMKPLSDWVHAQGLKFGIHLLRGIPRQTVKAAMPIAGSTYTAADAGDPADVCTWDESNYGVRDNAAGQAWYNAMIALYASWGVDYLKVDCISNRPYEISEIRQIAAAIRKTGRQIVLSLSPGPTALAHADEIGKYAQLWRISGDHWDVWSHLRKRGDEEFPMGTLQAFDRLAAWNPYVKPGNWPDEDTLPFGSLTPHPGWGEPRESRLTHDEEQSEFTLWAIGRSPLILGANLTELDDFTRSLITNKDVTEMNQTATQSRNSPSHGEDIRIWTASGDHSRAYVAVFNVSDRPAESELDWASSSSLKDLHSVYDIWNKTQLVLKAPAQVKLRPHACSLFRLE
jgi:alpha-galactosidase